MKPTALGLLLCCLAVACCTGCSAFSQLAYSVGAALDPSVQPCVDHIGSCSLCGEPPNAAPNYPVGRTAVGAPPIQQVDYTQGQCVGRTHQAFPQSQIAADVTGQIAELRAETAGFREEMDVVNQQLLQRGQALVQTRAELDRVRSDVIGLRGNVSQWQQSVQSLHQQIRQRDAERLAVLSDMSASLQQIMRENVQRR